MQLTNRQRLRLEKILTSQMKKIEKKVKRYFFTHRFVFTSSSIYYEDLIQEVNIQAWKTLLKHHKFEKIKLRKWMWVEINKALLETRKKASSYNNRLGVKNPKKTVTKHRTNKKNQIKLRKTSKKVSVDEVDSVMYDNRRRELDIEDAEFYMPMLTKNEREILIDRILFKLSYKDIAKKNNYTKQRAQQIYEKTYKKLSQIVKDEENL